MSAMLSVCLFAAAESFNMCAAASSSCLTDRLLILLWVACWSVVVVMLCVTLQLSRSYTRIRGSCLERSVTSLRCQRHTSTTSRTSRYSKVLLVGSSLQLQQQLVLLQGQTTRATKQSIFCSSSSSVVWGGSNSDHSSSNGRCSKDTSNSCGCVRYARLAIDLLN